MECLFGAERIHERVQELAVGLRGLVGPRPVVLLGVLQGAVYFATDLARALEGSVDLSFVAARSYGKGTVSSGHVELGPLDTELLSGEVVVVVDTVVDTGRTLAATLDAVRGAGAAEVASCVLLDKPARREIAVAADLVGFEIADRFVVGYGLDHAGRHRALPYVGVLKQCQETHV